MRALAFAIALTAPAAALACEFELPEELAIEGDPTDVTAPSSPVVAIRKVQRGNDYGGDGCGEQTSCDGAAYVAIDLSATDDSSAPVGYRVEAPLLVQNGKVLVAKAGSLYLHLRLSDDGEDELAFTLKVAAVDSAGNVSEERSIEVRDEGDGCQLGGGHSGALLLALTLAMRRALCRRTRGAAANRP
jgi:hypothetical protein